MPTSTDSSSSIHPVLSDFDRVVAYHNPVTGATISVEEMDEKKHDTPPVDAMTDEAPSPPVERKLMPDDTIVVRQPPRRTESATQTTILAPYPTPVLPSQSPPAPVPSHALQSTPSPSPSTPSRALPSPPPPFPSSPAPPSRGALTAPTRLFAGATLMGSPFAHAPPRVSPPRVQQPQPRQHILVQPPPLQQRNFTQQPPPPQQHTFVPQLQPQQFLGAPHAPPPQQQQQQQQRQPPPPHHHHLPQQLLARQQHPQPLRPQQSLTGPLPHQPVQPSLQQHPTPLTRFGGFPGEFIPSGPNATNRKQVLTATSQHLQHCPQRQCCDVRLLHAILAVREDSQERCERYNQRIQALETRLAALEAGHPRKRQRSSFQRFS